MSSAPPASRQHPVAPRRCCCLIAALLLAVSASATTGEPLQLSIEEALRLAIKRSESVDSARANVRRSQADIVRARSAILPQLNASIAYERTQFSEFDVLFPASAETSAFQEELPFGRLNSWRIGAGLSQVLFRGGTLASIDAAAASSSVAEAALDSARASAVLDVAQAYYDAVLAQRLAAIAQSTLELALETLETTRVGRNVGAVAQFDLLRAQVAVDQERTLLLQRQLESDIALLRLRQLLDLAPDQPLVLTSSLGDTQLESPADLAREVAGIPSQEVERAPVRQAAGLVDVRASSVDVAQGQWLPNLTLVSDFAWTAYPSTLFPSSNDLLKNWTVGVGLQVPLFTGLRITGEVRAAQAELERARATLKVARELARLDTVGARRALETALAVWGASAGVVQQAEQAYEIADLRFREGVSSQIELTDARLSLQLAQATRARAARNLQLARIRSALLPNLPLGSGGVTGTQAQEATLPTSEQGSAVPESTSSDQTLRQGGTTGFDTGAGTLQRGLESR